MESMLNEINEMHRRLGEYDPVVAVQRIKNTFDLTEEKAKKVYRIWRDDFLIPKVSVDYTTAGRKFREVKSK